MNRLFLFCFCCITFAPAVSAQDWQAMDLSTSETIRAVTDWPRPWLAGTGGFAAKGEWNDDGITWTPVDLGTTASIHSFEVVSSSGHWVGGSGGTMRFTTDAGITWTPNNLPDPSQAFVVDRPSTTYIALGSAGSIYTSPDHDGVWEERVSGTTASLNDINVDGATHAVGNLGTILRADNALGETWTSVVSGITANLHAISGSAGGVLVIVGEDGLILRSTDNGVNWTPRNSGTAADLHSIKRASSNASVLYAVGANGTVLRSDNAGDSWCNLETGITEALYDVFASRFNNINRLVVAGESGTVLYSDTGGGACVPVANEASAPGRGFSMSPLWPNPALQQTSFTLTVERPQHVTADVYDMLGRRIVVLLDRAMQASGSHTLTLNTSNLPGGTYLLRVVGEFFSESRRLTVQ